MAILAYIIFFGIFSLIGGMVAFYRFSKKHVAKKKWASISANDRALLIAAVSCGALRGPGLPFRSQDSMILVSDQNK